MKKFKGTKGEWFFEFSKFSQISPNGQSIVKSGEVGTPVCIIPMPIGGINTKEKNEANAKLIAAAPELLEALQGILKTMPLGFQNEYTVLASEAISKVL